MSNLRRALREIASLGQVAGVSHVYETRPLYVAEQPAFLNAAAELLTSVAAETLLDAIHAIESQLGRNRGVERRMGPRPIDIDILLYGGSIVTLPNLVIPHPRMTQRAFVLVPLLEIAPDLREPATGRPYASYLPTLESQVVTLWKESL